MYSEIAANKRRTVYLMFGFFVLISAIAYGVSWYYGNFSITIIALVFAVGYVLWSFFGSDKLALSVNNAQEIVKSDNPRLWTTVENLAITTGEPMPKVYIMDDPAPNAFATGRDPQHASVAVTSGLLNMMDDKELQGVLAHEMGHVQNFDIRVMMVVFGLVAVISIISDIVLRSMFWGGRGRSNREGGNNPVFLIIGLIALVLAPIVATIIQLAISRKREYLADATGALTTRYPEGLASALEKIENSGSAMQKQNPSTAHLFFANPLKGGSLSGLFSTHPPIEETNPAIARNGEQGMIKKPLSHKKVVAKKVKKPKVVMPKLPSAWTLVKKTWFECSTFWRPLLGIVVVYAVLYFIFVLGLSLSTSWRDGLVLSQDKFGQIFSTIFGAFGAGGFSSTTSSDATTLVQFLLFLLASMAFIWTLRKLQALKQIKLREAYYQGSAALIPTILVTVVLALTLVPAILGSGFLATALQLSAAGSEVLIVSSIAGVLVLFSLFLFFMFWPAFYIVSLPQTKPIQALRSALKITKKRRLAIVRKVLFWLLVSVIIMLVILVPFAVAAPTAVAYVVFILLFLLFGFSHVYLYNLYRSLL